MARLLHIIKRLDCNEYWGSCDHWVSDPAFARKFSSMADLESYLDNGKIFICDKAVSFDASLIDKAMEMCHAAFMLKRAEANTNEKLAEVNGHSINSNRS